MIAIGPEVAQLVVVGLWASTFIVTKHAFAELTPLAFTFVRFGLMTTLGFTVLFARGRSWRIGRRDWPRFALAGLSGYTFYQLGFVLGLERTSPWGAVSSLGWLEIGYMVVLPVYVAYMLWNWAIARRGAAKATSFTLLVPIASGALSAWLFGEQFGVAKLLGAALVLTGLAIIRTSGKRQTQ